MVWKERRKRILKVCAGIGQRSIRSLLTNASAAVSSVCFCDPSLFGKLISAVQRYPKAAVSLHTYHAAFADESHRPDLNEAARGSFAAKSLF